MARPFAKLRVALYEQDITQKYLARKLLLSQSWISQKMQGKVSWTLEEMYTLIELVKWPTDHMHELFPRGGISDTTAKAKEG